MSYIIFVRHGESEGNVLKLLAGQADVALTEKGKEQARHTAAQIKHIPIHKAYTSKLRRAKETLNEIQNELELSDVPVVTHAALNERDFGALTNRSKSDVTQELGEQGYLTVIRGWDTPAPDGESLEMVYNRAVPYFQTEIIADARSGKNVIVVSHHQTLRALMKYLEDIPHDKIAELKLKNAEAIIYEFDSSNDTLRRHLA